jgi:amidase
MRTLSGAMILVGLSCVAVEAQSTVAGEWVLTVEEQFGPSVMRLSLSTADNKLTGSFGTRKIDGKVNGSSIELTGDEFTAKATLEGDSLKGEAVVSERRWPDTTPSPRTLKWSAVRIPARPSTPQTHDFEPSQFHQYFSSKIKPALRIHPGDRVRTWAVDAGGRDKHGERRSGGGNPQTGPFYVEGALPNDTLVVRINEVRTNRDWAGSGSTIMRNALDPWTLGYEMVTRVFQPVEAGS